MRGVLPHPGMLPSGPCIASPGCSRRRVTLSIGSRKTGFPVRSASLLSCPDLAPPEPRRAAAGTGRSGATRSHAQRAPFARAWRGWRAPHLPRSEHRGTLRTSRRIRPSPLHSTYKRYVTKPGPQKQRQVFEATDACSGVFPAASAPNTILWAISPRGSKRVSLTPLLCT
jgi:hypothetical protein